MLDRAVLAGGVHRLEHQRQRPRAVRVERFLAAAKRGEAVREQVGGLGFRADAARVVRIDVLEARPPVIL